MERAIQVFTEHLQEYIEQSMEQVLQAGIPVYAGMPRATLRGRIEAAFIALTEDVVQGTSSAYAAYLGQIGATRAKQGTPIREMIHGLEYAFKVVTEHFEEVFADDLDARLWWAQRAHEMSYAGALSVTDAYYTAREAIITEQHKQILRLSAPIMQLHTGVLLMPIVGALDAERASQVLETLLQSIVRHRSQMVIIDVTGMHADDEGATEHIMQAARAARLLGARVFLVGISPEAAVLLTSAGVSFSDLSVLSDLKSGVELALRLRAQARIPSWRATFEGDGEGA